MFIFSPEEHTLVLDPPPFIILAEELGEIPDRFWAQFGASEKISAELTIIIADYFGLGSDTLSPSIIEPIATTTRLFACYGGNGGNVTPGSAVPKPSTNFADMLALEAAQAL